MTAWTWYAQGRHVSALSAVDSPAPVLSWSPDPAFAGSSLPWALPEYPTLLILGLGVTLVTSGVAANRRLIFTIAHVGGGQTQWISSGVTAASLTRRYELQVGFSLETTLANDTFREPLPRGLLLPPGLIGGPAGTLTVSGQNLQAGDALGAVSLRGSLLYP